MKPLSGRRICMAASDHPPGDDRIFFKEARSLVRAGAEVTLVCAGGRRLPDDQAGVRFVTFEGGGGLRRRALAVGRLADTLRRQECELIHCHEPDSLVAALRVKREKRIKILFDSHEMWAASAAQRFPAPLWRPVMWAYGLLERRWLRRCDGAIGASWAISDYLASVVGRERVETILNVPVVEVFGEGPPRSWGEETLLCHDGTLGFDRGLKTMAEAVRLVAAKHRVVLKIVGDVFGEERAWLDSFVARHGLEGVIVRTGWLPYEQVGQALAPCHIGLIGLQEIPNNVVTSSNKVFNYLLYGIPFVAPSFRLSKIKMVEEDRCGVLADSADPSSYADAICGMIENRRLTEEMSRRALLASRLKYRWEHMEAKLLAFYERLLTAKEPQAGTSAHG